MGKLQRLHNYRSYPLSDREGGALSNHGRLGGWPSPELVLWEIAIEILLRRLRIFGQRDKLKADRSKGA